MRLVWFCWDSLSTVGLQLYDVLALSTMVGLVIDDAASHICSQLTLLRYLRELLTCVALSSNSTSPIPLNLLPKWMELEALYRPAVGQ